MCSAGWERKYKKLAIIHKGLGDRVNQAEEALAQLQNEYQKLLGSETIASARQARADSEEWKTKYQNLEQQRTDSGQVAAEAQRRVALLDNRIRNMLASVRDTYGSIRALNANTPYRPMAIQRTIEDLMRKLEKIGNVETR